MADARGELRKAVLRRLDGQGELTVHFNPSELRIAKSSTWTAGPARGAATAPPPDFGGANPRDMGLRLLLDARSSGADVAADAQTLQSWLNPTEESIGAGTPQPPLLRLDWTSPALFDAYLTNVDVTYVLFDRDGSPLRANVDAKLKESPTSAQAQNPTSGGDAGHRTHVLEAGESLQSLAHRLYRDPALWRGLARYNRIADPLRVRPGRRVDLPPAAVVRELAR
jgi:hypothetical protein